MDQLSNLEVPERFAGAPLRNHEVESVIAIGQESRGCRQDPTPPFVGTDLRIAPGESVEFETVDASSGQLTKTSTAADLEKLDLGRVNPVTGPVWIDGAMPGDALKVTVLSLRPSGWGTGCTPWPRTS